MKILLVEDEQSLGELLKKSLISSHYTVDLATDGETGLELAGLQKYDLVILDIQLPKLDGLSICRKLRSQGFALPILILTNCGSSQDIAAGLDAGADDYLTKPCNITELQARIRALLRRGNLETTSTILTWGNLSLDPALPQVTYQQKIVALRPKEYSLLELFLRHPQRIFSRDAIIDRLWTIDDVPTTHAVTNLIKDLRHRLHTAGMTQELIETVYGIGYRVNPQPQDAPKDREMELGDRQRSREKNSPKNSVLELIPQEIAKIQERFADSLDRRVEILRSAGRALQTGELTAERRAAAQAEAHRLAGSLGTFGYPRGSDLAKLIEYLLMGPTTPESQHSVQMNQLILELEQELNKPPNARMLNSTTDPLVLFVGDDLNFADALYKEAVERKFQFALVEEEKILHWLTEKKTAAVVLTLNSSCPEMDGLSLLRVLKQQFSTIPVLTLAPDRQSDSSIDSIQESLHQRVQVARLGGDRYLPLPVPPKQVFDAIAQMLPQPAKPEAKVMIVDDDPMILAYLSNLLRSWGMQVTCLENPSQFWGILTAIQPDLLLLDLEMPTFNGIELCQVIRQEPKYDDLAILVVTAHTDRASIQQAFAAGADDLISKPVVEPELVNRVLTQIERLRLRQQQTYEWQKQATIDTLTQITNRRAFNRYLQQSWQRLQSKQLPLSLILCGVDEFKLYNDFYGYPAGDLCLQQIASTIVQCIKLTTDRAARFGSDEFAILLPNTMLEGALSIAERIQQAIAQLQIPHSNAATHPYVSLSLGITSTVPATDKKSCDDIINAACQSLYAAKEKGRNTYYLYSL
ncbi:Multi-component transcriptional regulator [Tumidithrix helvetica PCC 7403]|uniref:response regulator n=1 Tax=Tumidithrix helvetica TaxID=3457545 RepID=UPI003CA4A882